MKAIKFIITISLLAASLTPLCAQETGSAERIIPTFGGYMITPGPLYYDGSSFKVDTDCFRNSYKKTHSLNAGSTYFTFVEIGKHFDSRGEAFTYTSGEINNKGKTVRFGDYDDWRLPSAAEWNTIFGMGRTGANVNGHSHACYTMIAVKGDNLSGHYETIGALLFPDNATIKGRWLKDVNNKTTTYNFTKEQLQAYLDQGCVFIPSGGLYFFDRLDWNYGGFDGFYHTTTSIGEQITGSFRFGTKIPGTFESLKLYHSFMVRLIRKTQ